jgi:hypothetical protein
MMVSKRPARGRAAAASDVAGVLSSSWWMCDRKCGPYGVCVYVIVDCMNDETIIK